MTQTVEFEAEHDMQERVPAYLAWLRGLIPDKHLTDADRDWRRVREKKHIRLPASEPAPIRLRGPDGQRAVVLSLDAMLYAVPDGVAEDADDGLTGLLFELLEQGFDEVEADYIVAVKYEKCPRKDLCRRLGCGAQEVERRATSVRRRIDRIRYEAAVAHEKAFLRRATEFSSTWPED